MHDKLLKNNRIGNFTNRNPINNARERPILNEAQQKQAALVSKLPKDFPIAGWEKMNTKQQLQAMKFSGLNTPDQWTLLNANEKLSTLNEYNQAQNQTGSEALVASVAASLLNATARASALRAQAAVGKQTISTSLQTTAQQRKLDMKQEEYETRFYEKQARRPITLNTQNEATKTPEGEKPTYDSRDAMEQKKDEMWGLFNGKLITHSDESTTTPLPRPGIAPVQTPNPYQDDDTSIFPEAQPLPLPPGVIPSDKEYRWYDSYEEAAYAWAEENVDLSKDLERCAMIYKNLDKDGNERYTFTKSYYGMDAVPFFGIRPNVVIPFVKLRYLDSGIPESDIVGFIHSHPEPPEGQNYLELSPEDLSLGKYGIKYVTVVPYENGGIPETVLLIDED